MALTPTSNWRCACLLVQSKKFKKKNVKDVYGYTAEEYAEWHHKVGLLRNVWHREIQE